MTTAFLNAIAEQWPALLFVAVALLCLMCGGPFRFLVRFFATGAAVLMALSSFSALMDRASRVFGGMTLEALRQLWKEIRANRRDALAEMGEQA